MQTRFAKLLRHPELLLLLVLIGNIAFYVSIAARFA